jgi:hypothetical protein
LTPGAVTASCCPTNVCAGVSIVAVAVIAGLSSINAAVSATLEATLGVTAVARVVVSVIAAFIAIELSVSAAFNAAKRITAVAGIEVSVVASLNTNTQGAVAACREGATVEAGVADDLVSIITGLKPSLALS